MSCTNRAFIILTHIPFFPCTDHACMTLSHKHIILNTPHDPTLYRCMPTFLQIVKLTAVRVDLESHINTLTSERNMHVCSLDDAQCRIIALEQRHEEQQQQVTVVASCILYGNPPQLGSLPELVVIYDNLPELVAIYGNLPELVAIYATIYELVAIYGNLPELVAIYGNLPELVAIYMATSLNV